MKLKKILLIISTIIMAIIILSAGFVVFLILAAVVAIVSLLVRLNLISFASSFEHMNSPQEQEEQDDVVDVDYEIIENDNLIEHKDPE